MKLNLLQKNEMHLSFRKPDLEKRGYDKNFLDATWKQKPPNLLGAEIQFRYFEKEGAAEGYWVPAGVISDHFRIPYAGLERLTDDEDRKLIVEGPYDGNEDYVFSVQDLSFLFNPSYVMTEKDKLVMEYSFLKEQNIARGNVPNFRKLEDRLYEQFVDLVCSIARTVLLGAKTTFYISPEEIEPYCWTGFFQAAGTYHGGGEVVSYVYSRIYGAGVDYVRQVDALTREGRKQAGILQKEIDTFTSKNLREPRREEILSLAASNKEITDSAEELLDSLIFRYIRSLTDKEDGDELELIEKIPSDCDPTDIEAITNSDLEALEKDLAALSARQQSLLLGYYSEGLTMRELADLHGLTEARISQIVGDMLKPENVKKYFPTVHL